MPDRTFRLTGAAHEQDGAAGGGINDNFGPLAGIRIEPRAEPLVPQAGAPEPEWQGPGAILALGMQDGLHGLGAVRAAAAAEVTGNPGDDMATLLRLLAHYGNWLGFEGRAEPVRRGTLRRLPVVVGGEGRVEYRLDLRRIARDAQRLTADGMILLDGRPAAMLEGLSIAFRAQTKVQSAARNRAQKHARSGTRECPAAATVPAPRVLQGPSGAFRRDAPPAP
jgi:hypothetical protein